jgi:hypothetical protein
VGIFFSMPVAVRSQAQVCGHSIREIAGSNPAEGVKGFIICCVLCRKRSLRRVDHSFRVVQMGACVCVCVCVCA